MPDEQQRNFTVKLVTQVADSYPFLPEPQHCGMHILHGVLGGVLLPDFVMVLRTCLMPLHEILAAKIRTPRSFSMCRVCENEEHPQFASTIGPSVSQHYLTA